MKDQGRKWLHRRSGSAAVATELGQSLTAVSGPLKVDNHRAQSVDEGLLEARPLRHRGRPDGAPNAIPDPMPPASQRAGWTRSCLRTRQDLAEDSKSLGANSCAEFFEHPCRRHRSNPVLRHTRAE